MSRKEEFKKTQEISMLLSRAPIHRADLANIVEKMYNGRMVGHKFRLCGGQVVKMTNGEILPEDEPLFLMRARDNLAVELLLEYLLISERNQGVPPEYKEE